MNFRKHRGQSPKRARRCAVTLRAPGVAKALAALQGAGCDLARLQAGARSCRSLNMPDGDICIAAPRRQCGPISV